MRTFVKPILALMFAVCMAVTSFSICATAEAYGASAITIPIKENVQNSGSIDYYGDGDIYTFTLNQPASLFIYIDAACPEVGFRLRTDNGHQITIKNGEAILPVGKYFVDVIATDCNDSNIYGAYTLVTQFQSLISKDEATEPNSTPEQAVKLKSGVTVEGTAYYLLDYDWYKLVVSKKSRVDFLLDRSYAYQADVFDAALNYVLTVENSAFGTAQKQDLAAGTYYIQLYQTSSLKSNYEFTATVIPYPSTPKITSITQNFIGRNTIKWKSVAGADGYEVYRKFEPNGQWYKLDTISSGKTCSYVDNYAPRPGEKTWYSIKAFNDIGTGYYPLYSDLDEKGTVKTATVPKPSKISTKVSDGKIKISWGKVTNADGYKIYRKINHGEYKLVKTVQSYSTTSWKDTSTVKGKIYRYKVKAYCNGKSSAYTRVVKKQMTGSISAPANVKTKKYKGYNKISWKKKVNASGYKVYRKVGNGSYKLVKTINAGKTTSWNDKDIKSGKKYTYKVKSFYRSYYENAKGKLKYKAVHSKYSKTSSVKR